MRLGIVLVVLCGLASGAAGEIDKQKSRKATCEKDCSEATKKSGEYGGDCRKAEVTCQNTVQARQDACGHGCQATKSADYKSCEAADPTFKTTCYEAADKGFTDCNMGCRARTFYCTVGEAKWQTEACQLAQVSSASQKDLCDSCKEM